MHGVKEFRVVNTMQALPTITTTISIQFGSSQNVRATDRRDRWQTP